MGKHILNLNIPDISNEGIFVVEDISIYDTITPVGCMTLQITPPGYQSPTIYTPDQQHFRLVLNACTLGIVGPTGCSTTCPNIPDGIYKLYYTVAPADKVYVGYNYLRITSAVNRQRKMLCELRLPCCLPNKEEQYMIQELDIIYDYLISAQTNVNTSCGDAKDGINQYRYAIGLMDKLSSRKPFC